jgi:hypothetical protein
VRRKWALIVFVVVCAVGAAIVSWWPDEHSTVRVESSDQQGICVRNLATDEQQCLEYSPEFPSEARYRVGECLRFEWVYRSDTPPHVERITCPEPAA